MRIFSKVNLIDAFMLIWAVLPFLVLHCLSTQIIMAWLDPMVNAILTVLFSASCLGFPMATLLYFYWRVKPSRSI